MLRLCLGMSYVFLARSDEVFANGSGVVSPAHCLTRSDVAFFFLATDSWGVFNGVKPIGLRCDSAVIKATRLKLIASLYVPGARVGARVLSRVKVVGQLLL